MRRLGSTASGNPTRAAELLIAEGRCTGRISGRYRGANYPGNAPTAHSRPTSAACSRPTTARQCCSRGAASAGAARTAALNAIVALLADAALLTMPPEAARFEASAQIGAFFATVPMDGDSPVSGSSQPARTDSPR